MEDGTSKNEVPTFHANVVTSLLSVDEMTMELRWFAKPHKAWAQQANAPVKMIPPASAEELMAVEPVARVVLTFNAVRALKQYLDSAFPEIERTRRSA